MALHYLASDLIIARSGAVTCAEVNAIGKFALFIPLPIGNGEQALNAQHLVDQGRAKVISQSVFTAEWLLEHIDSLLVESSTLSDAGNPEGLDAVDKIVDMIEKAL